MTQENSAASTEGRTASHATAPVPVSVVTQMIFNVPPDRVWKGLVFYEELAGRPPLYLRLLLPVPIRNLGKVSNVGDEVTCLYEEGQLVKRITKIERDTLYEFEVAEQALSIGAGMRLCGGYYRLRALPDNQTEVSVATRYFSPRWPRWLWTPLEKVVCHCFHRHLLRSMRQQMEAE